MKTNHLKALAAALVLTSYAGFAAAGGTTTVQVKATVNAVCKFSATAPTAIDLGAIDPSALSADVTGTTSVFYQCTKGTTPTVTKTGGGTSLSDGTNSITYAFTLGTPDMGTGFSAAGTAKVVGTATIAQAAAQDAVASTGYTDTVTLTINN